MFGAVFYPTRLSRHFLRQALMANLITIARVVLLFVAIGFIYRLSIASELIALALVAGVILLDWIDGVVARRSGHADETGAVLDILADRIVENSLWIVFADIGLIPVWIPLVVLVRGLATDALRALALRRGMTPFGERTVMRSRLGRALVVSRTSRAAYAVAKFLAFSFLILLLAASAGFDRGAGLGGALGSLSWMYTLGLVFAYTAVALCLVRGIPVILDGWTLLRKS